MAKFYFTYGLEGQPFVGGWTEIEADYYSENQFMRTQMAGPGGNLGRRCHERITVTRVTND